ncbi:hypothetical protein K492DRAFT_76087 [Lichtheimia hyalospora FSU 10163]|nr:hypothetical protein K492DRAFT_76087 [Lichtheimia hyalospora FSU 10163]
METQFAPMKSLGYPSQEIVTKPAKDVNQQLADQRKKLQQDTGFGLSVKSYHHYNGPRKKSSRSRTRSSPNADGGGHSNTEETASRAEGWNISWMGVYGHVVEKQQAFSPLKQPGVPFNNASVNDRLLPHADTIYWPPPENKLPRQDQKELVDLFYLHINPPTPVFRRSVFDSELEKCIINEKSSFLSPFFFYSAFTIAAQFSDRLRKKIQPFCLEQALAFRQVYFGYPCVSSVLALLMLSTYMERTKMHPYTNYSWALAGEAFTMVQDLGLHRMCNVSPNPADQELASRIFWVAFVCDRLLCVATGRPFTFDEKDM